jgi:hypothetical protein
MATRFHLDQWEATRRFAPVIAIFGIALLILVLIGLFRAAL